MNLSRKVDGEEKGKKDYREDIMLNLQPEAHRAKG
jgi:hypothetical protein